MEMEIGALAMNMAMSNIIDGVSVGMMKKTMEAQQQQMEAVTDMLDSMPMPSPDGRGKLLDIRV